MLSPCLIGTCLVLFPPRLSNDPDTYVHPIEYQISPHQQRITERNETEGDHNEYRQIDRKANRETGSRG
jgi:hypothetical protein